MSAGWESANVKSALESETEKTGREGRLIELSKMCEEAEGPSRELDEEIALALNIYVREKRGKDRQFWFYKVGGGDYERRSVHRYAGTDGLPRFTASLDAALSLVPDEMDWRVCTLTGLQGAIVCRPNACLSHKTAPRMVTAKFPALALCAAALKARAASDMESAA